MEGSMMADDVYTLVTGAPIPSLTVHLLCMYLSIVSGTPSKGWIQFYSVFQKNTLTTRFYRNTAKAYWIVLMIHTQLIRLQFITCQIVLVE